MLRPAGTCAGPCHGVFSSQAVALVFVLAPGWACPWLAARADQGALKSLRQTPAWQVQSRMTGRIDCVERCREFPLTPRGGVRGSARIV